MIPLQDIVSTDRSVIPTLSTETNPILSINNFRNYQHSSSSSQFKQRLIFFPFVTLYLGIPFFLWYKYLSCAYTNPFIKDSILYITIFLFSMIMLCYFSAALTSPTQSNVNQFFDSSNDVSNIDKSKPGRELKSLNADEWGDCEYCKSKKFIRASHCRQCNKCILMRDHHCIWIANCVGFQNIQYFVNLLTWLLFTGFIYIYIFIKCMWYYSDLSKIKENGLTSTVAVINWIAFIFVVLFMMNLLGMIYRIYNNIYNNKMFYERTRDFSIEEYSCLCSVDNRQKNYNEHNIGFMSHFYYLIGPTIFHYILPISKGFHYILNEDCPVFRKNKQPSSLEMIKYLSGSEKKYVQMLVSKENEPNFFIELSHKHYEGKDII